MSKKRYPLRIPRFAAGIRAQELRGGVSRSWWARRWLEKVEPMGFGGRLARGRNYAVSGQITSMKMMGPKIVADVVGTRPDPYRVEMDFTVPEESVREAIVADLRAEPMLIARLLADELPMEVEEIFRRRGASLFPGGKLGPGKYDVTIGCSCPDWANPCKHSCAVMLILGEEVARRPLTLLELRGITEEELYDED